MVIDGRGACPREDGRGIVNWEKALKTLAEGPPKERQDVLREIYQSYNYEDHVRVGKVPGTYDFDPNRFIADEAMARVKDALSLPMSLRSGSKVHVQEMYPGAAFDSHRAKGSGKKARATRTELGPGSVIIESSTSARDGISARACSNCGTPHNLTL